MAYYTIPVHVFKKANIGLGTNDPIGTFAPELCRFGVLTHTAHLGYKCHACAGYRGGRGVYRLAAVIAEVEVPCRHQIVVQMLPVIIGDFYCRFKKLGFSCVTVHVRKTVQRPGLSAAPA